MTLNVEPPPALRSFSTYSTLPDGDPPTLADALRRPDSQHWIKAMAVRTTIDRRQQNLDSLRFTTRTQMYWNQMGFQDKTRWE